MTREHQLVIVQYASFLFAHDIETADKGMLPHRNKKFTGLTMRRSSASCASSSVASKLPSTASVNCRNSTNCWRSRTTLPPASRGPAEQPVPTAFGCSGRVRLGGKGPRQGTAGLAPGQAGSRPLYAAVRRREQGRPALTFPLDIRTPFGR